MYGNRRYVKQRGKLDVTTHKTILNALDKRARRYKNSEAAYDEQLDDILFNAAIDETRTVSTASESLSDGGGDSLGGDLSPPLSVTLITETEKEAIRGVNDEVLEVHGVAPGSKTDGTVRLLYENLNGINSRLKGNEKLEKAREVIDELTL